MGYKHVAQAESERFITIRPLGSKFDTHCQIVDALKEKGVF